MSLTHTQKLEQYYNKFNEEKRLKRRHGIVEFVTSMKYIHEYLNTMENPKILDIGAGTGRYSVALAEEGYDPEFGARPVKRAIQRMLLNQLSKDILAQKINRNVPIIIDSDGEQLVFRN